MTPLTTQLLFLNIFIYMYIYIDFLGLIITVKKNLYFYFFNCLRVYMHCKIFIYDCFTSRETNTII